MVAGSGIVSIAIGMKNGRVFEVEREHETSYFGYCWQGEEAYRLKMQLEMTAIETGNDLLMLMASYIEDFSSFIIGEDTYGKNFQSSVAAIQSFDEVEFVKISEETTYEDGETEELSLEFYNMPHDERIAEADCAKNLDCIGETLYKPVTTFSYQEVDLVHKDYFAGLITIADDEVLIDMPASNKVTVHIDGKDYTISHNLKPHLTKLFKDKPDERNDYKEALKLNNSAVFLYDPIEKVMEKYEELMRYKTGEDATKRDTKLTTNQIYTRICFFLKICKLCEDADVLDAILRYVLSSGGKQTRIATLGCSHEEFRSVTYNSYMFSLVAVPAGANQWTLQIAKEEIHQKNIQEIYKTMVAENPIPFNIALDAEKYMPRKAENKVRIVFDEIVLGLPVTMRPDGKLSFAHCPQMLLSDFANILRNYDDVYEITIPDVSKTIQTPIGLHSMSVVFDASQAATRFKEVLAKLVLIEKYFDGLVPWEEVSEAIKIAPFNFFREIIKNERIISWCFAKMLGQISLLISGKDLDLVNWTSNAKLKKDGTFNKTHVQYYDVNDDANQHFNISYRCACDTDKQYRIEPYGLFELYYQEAAQSIE